MYNKIINKIKPIGVFLLAFILLASNPADDKDKQLRKQTESNQGGDAYRLKVNRLDFPLNSRGVLGDVDFGGITGGEYDGKGLLYSGRFFLGGKNGALVWTNGVASASRIEDYLPGEVGGTNDPRAVIYALKSTDPHFGETWQEWKDAVDLGAYFYDGDKNGIYEPIDKEGPNGEPLNGNWDSWEDRPDLLGDETVWCVYNDALPSGQRAYPTVNPMGIEIRQTVWGYAVSGELGNMLFIRYSINNAGTVGEVFDSVYMGIWQDVDLGGTNAYTDDLVGCDTDLNAGYVYNDGPDDGEGGYGADPPCFLVDFFQGPLLETGNPADLALPFHFGDMFFPIIISYFHIKNLLLFFHPTKSLKLPSTSQRFSQMKLIFFINIFTCFILFNLNSRRKIISCNSNYNSFFLRMKSNSKKRTISTTISTTFKISSFITPHFFSHIKNSLL